MLTRFVPLCLPGAYLWLYVCKKKSLNRVYEHLSQKSNLTGLYDR
ncbi:Uncharacterised protein [Klebsiella pneumoniae]|nr:Uncharacterised protein [Klebsiella pneumoniae]SYU91203.1 Uncharacterised protein [Klebsiella pneumoniae]